MDLKGRRRSTNIEDRRGEALLKPSAPRYNQIDSTLDSKVFRGNSSPNMADKVAGKVAAGVIKVRQTLGYRNYADGGKVVKRRPNGKGC